LRASAKQVSTVPTRSSALAPTIRIISRIPVTVRWLKACTSVPRQTEIGYDVRLEVGSRDEIRLEGEDLVDVRCESTDAGLLTTSLPRAHDIAGDAPMRSCSPITDLETTCLAATEKQADVLARLATVLGWPSG